MGQIESFSPYKNSAKQLGWQSAGDTLSIPYPQGGFVLLLSRDGEERAAEPMPAAQGFSLDLNLASIRGETPQNDAGSPCRLPGGAVPLHQALLCPQALQAVPERDLLLQASAGGCHPPPPSLPWGCPAAFFLVLNPLLLAPRSLRRVYVINKEICVRTVCAHEELLRGKGQEGTRPPHTFRMPPTPGWLHLDGEEDADISGSSVHRSATSTDQFGGGGRQHHGVSPPPLSAH